MRTRIILGININHKKPKHKDIILFTGNIYHHREGLVCITRSCFSQDTRSSVPKYNAMQIHKKAGWNVPVLCSCPSTVYQSNEFLYFPRIEIEIINYP